MKLLFKIIALLTILTSCSEYRPQNVPQFHEKLSVGMYQQKCTELNTLEEYKLIDTAIQYKNDTTYFKVKALTTECASYIDSLIKTLLKETNQKDPEQLKIYGTDNFKKEMEGLDSILSYRTVSKILIGDPGNPRSDKWSAGELKLKIRAYNDNFKKITGRATVGLNVDFNYYINDTPVWWETAKFYHLPLIEILRYLKDLQITLRENQYAYMHST